MQVPMSCSDLIAGSLTQIPTIGMTSLPRLLAPASSAQVGTSITSFSWDKPEVYSASQNSSVFKSMSTQTPAYIERREFLEVFSHMSSSALCFWKKAAQLIELCVLYFVKREEHTQHGFSWSLFLKKTASVCNRSEEAEVEAGVEFISQNSARTSDTTFWSSSDIHVFVVYIAVRWAKRHPSALSGFSCFATPQTWT